MPMKYRIAKSIIPMRDTSNKLYEFLILSNSIWNYLDEINNKAEKRMETLVDQISKELGISASLKDKSKIEWVAKMRDVVIIAEDIVLEEIIYV